MPDDLGFMTLLIGFGGGEKIATTKNGTKAFVRTKVSRASSTSTAALSGSPPSPNDALKPAPSPEENPATSPELEKPDPVPETEKSATAPEAEKPAPSPETEKPTPTSEIEKPAAAEWTEGQDAVLADMKQQGKSWKEIEEALPAKDRGALKERYRYLCAKKQKEDGVVAQKEHEAECNDGKKAEDKKGKTEAKADDAKGTEKKSNLKESKGKEQEGVLKKIGDRPIIYMDSGDQLDAEELAKLYKLHAKAERGKWVEISSRFFDRTGKRITPDVLKEKLANC
ncbi:MAG: hypothetical protein Q9217_006494 [Psora testacea]